MRRHEKCPNPVRDWGIWSLDGAMLGRHHGGVRVSHLSSIAVLLGNFPMRRIIFGFVILTATATAGIVGAGAASADSVLHFYGPDALQSCTAELRQLDPSGTATGDWCGMDPGTAPGQGEILYIRPSINQPGDAAPFTAQGFGQRLAGILASGSASASQ